VKTGRGVRQGCWLLSILFNLYSKYLTKEAPEGFGDFKIERQVIHTVKYAADLVLLAKKKAQGHLHISQFELIEILTAYRRCYGM
jgi:hypothetical protein